MSDQPVISVILPTIRQGRILAALQSLQAAAELVPTEIIVVADFPAPIPHSPWYVRGRRGVIDAIQVGYAAARGEYVFVSNDETMVEPDCLHQLYQAAVTQPGRLLTPNHQPPFPFAYYGKPFAPFPFAHRDVFTKLGGLFDPAYRGFYADPDLSMRAHAAGVPVETVWPAVIHHSNSEDKSAAWYDYFLADRATFRSRWDHLGVFRDP